MSLNSPITTQAQSDQTMWVHGNPVRRHIEFRVIDEMLPILSK